MAFFELDDVFTYQDANDIKKLWAGDTAPVSPATGEVWLDTSAAPNQLKRYNGSSWDTIGELTASDLLNLLKTVDGSGSDLDADMVDGLEASQFIRSDSTDSFSGTITSTIISGAAIKFDDGGSMITVHNGMGNFNLQSGVDENKVITDGDGASHIRLDHTGRIRLSVSSEAEGNTFVDDEYMEITTAGVTINGNTVWHTGNDGSGSGLDADKVDGLEAASFIRSDTSDNVSGHTEWQDNCQARFGNDADLTIQHNGTDSYIDNNNGDIYIRQLKHGSNIHLQAEDTSGANKNLLTLDPDLAAAKIGGAVITEMYNETLDTDDILVTNIKYRSTGILFIRSDGHAAGAMYQIATNGNTFSGLLAGNNTIFSDTKDTASRINVYFEGNYLKIQNKRSSSLIRVGFIGCRFDG